MFNNYYKLYSIARFCIERRIPFVTMVLKIVKRLLFPASDIPFKCQLGGNVYIPHRAIGVVIHKNAVIGNNTKIETNVTIGGKKGKGLLVVGDNCLIGIGASILGGVRIGNDVIIGGSCCQGHT